MLLLEKTFFCQSFIYFVSLFWISFAKTKCMEQNIIEHYNGEASSVNIMLDDTTRPSLKIVRFVLGKKLLM
jgi:hypothetical protein